MTRWPERIATGGMLVCAAVAGADVAFGSVAVTQNRNGSAAALFAVAVVSGTVAVTDGYLAIRWRNRRVVDRDRLRR